MNILGSKDLFPRNGIILVSRRTFRGSVMIAGDYKSGVFENRLNSQQSLSLSPLNQTSDEKQVCDYLHFNNIHHLSLKHFTHTQGQNALEDAKLEFKSIQAAVCSYCYGEPTCGQRAGKYPILFSSSLSLVSQQQT